MKKNILSVIIAALTVINVILTAIMFFVMLPTFQKTNNLITQVASVLNLELDQGDSEGSQDYTLKDLEQYSVAFESQQTLNLVAGDDVKMHYAPYISTRRQRIIRMSVRRSKPMRASLPM